MEKNKLAKQLKTLMSFKKRSGGKRGEIELERKEALMKG